MFAFEAGVVRHGQEGGGQVVEEASVAVQFQVKVSIALVGAVGDEAVFNLNGKKYNLCKT